MSKRKSPKTKQITLSGIPITITRKKVKNINIRVYPSKQDVHISAPRHVRLTTVIKFAESKIEWIENHLTNYQPSVQPFEPEYCDGEVHLYRGKKMQLQLSTHHAPPEVTVQKDDKILVMKVRAGSTKEKRAAVLKEWYRANLKATFPGLIEKWEQPMGVSVNEFGVKQMKTRWGSCNTRAKRIWLNLELAKRSPSCLQYVVVHEMVHLLERLHNARFYGFMDQFLPEWRKTEKELQGKVD